MNKSVSEEIKKIDNLTIRKIISFTKKEGIESKMDLTFDSGYYNIASKKNGIHACANNSLITMYDVNIVVVGKERIIISSVLCGQGIHDNV